MTTTLAHAANDDIRAALRGGKVTDPAWKDADGKVTCQIGLIMSTPVTSDPSPENAIDNLKWHAEQAAERVAAIKALADNGWEMTAGMLIDRDGGDEDENLPDLRTIGPLTPISGVFCDVQLLFRKRLATEADLETEVANAGVTEKEGWGVGWNEVDGKCEWLGEA